MASSQQEYLPLQKAFVRFQEHCETLESVHKDLRSQLKKAHLKLEEKNKELASRIEEIEFMRGRLSGILENITDSVLLLDNNGRVEVANNSSQVFFKENITGKLIQSLIPEIESFIDDVKVSVRDKEIKLSEKHNGKIILLTCVPTVDSLSQGSRVIAIKDITEQRQLQNRLSRKNRLAALGKIAANVAHEIRNPLGAISGFATLLKGDLSQINSPLSSLASKIIYASVQLNAVVVNMLNYARDPVYSFAFMELVPLVNDVLELIYMKAEDMHVNVDFLFPETPLLVHIDHIQIKQVISNLLTNALEACPVKENASVKIILEKTEKDAIISVWDNGEGIPLNAQKKIFDPFFTLKEGGIGLGLPLCLQIVESHGGTISMESTAELGTTFTVSLPLLHKNT